MTPQFAEAVDPVFLYVLGLLERLESDAKVVPEEEVQRIRSQLDTAEGRLGPTEDWLLAKYALVSWIDEMLHETPWAGQATWMEQWCLERQLFSQRIAAEVFFEKAKQAAILQSRDALEVFYLCVVLGFRGLYRNATSAESLQLIEHLQLPPDIEAWARQTATSLRLRIGRPPLPADGLQPGQGAPALEAQTHFVNYVLVGLVLLAANAITVALIWG